MDGRLQSSVMVGALKRLAENEGGFAAILAKGDSRAGAILVILAEKGRKLRMLERSLLPDGRYAWADVGSQTIENEDQNRLFLDRRRKVDPDLWIIELDIASAERFAAEMNLTL
jgi:hypothetical protein